MGTWEGYMMYVTFNILLGLSGTVLSLQDKHAYAWIPWLLIAISQYKMPRKEAQGE